MSSRLALFLYLARGDPSLLASLQEEVAFPLPGERGRRLLAESEESRGLGLAGRHPSEAPQKSRCRRGWEVCGGRAWLSMSEQGLGLETPGPHTNPGLPGAGGQDSRSTCHQPSHPCPAPSPAQHPCGERVASDLGDGWRPIQLVACADDATIPVSVQSRHAARSLVVQPACPTDGAGAEKWGTLTQSRTASQAGDGCG